jgi:hypothetical protein
MKALMMVLALVIATPAAAATSAPVWNDETFEQTGKYGQPELVDYSLGTWCYVQTTNKRMMVFERRQKCSTAEIWVSPKGYRAIDRECKMLSIGHANYHKNVVIKYNCKMEAAAWTEEVEVGFFSDDRLFIELLSGGPPHYLSRIPPRPLR